MNKDKILANILADSELACLPDIFLRLNTLNQGKPTYTCGSTAHDDCPKKYKLDAEI